MDRKTPKLRTVDKSLPPFKLNQFPSDFPYILGKELVYLLASKGKAILEGPEWESIFATCIGADWKPSNVGLDDVILGNTAWGAKTVKARQPSRQAKIRLISGRNSPFIHMAIQLTQMQIQILLVNQFLKSGMTVCRLLEKSFKIFVR